ncbi:MAG TPA: hypothetical protein VN026_12675 [Bacteroidia bacterium]|nr:hypothetical protein [Bacteroidia bacterium]
MNTNNINYINIGLMVVSCIVAFFIPFELFLFSYGVLGPLHYLTEIGWLHKKNYFTKGKYDFVFLTVICVALFYYTFYPPKDHLLVANLIAFAFFVSITFVFVKDWLYRIVLIALTVAAVSIINNFNDYFIWIGIFLPTIIHVFIFTWLFMLYGVLKEKSFSGFLSVAVLIICASTFFFIRPSGLNYVVSDTIKKNYHMFDQLNFHLINIFHLDSLHKISDVFITNSGFVIMRFVAFAYTYHYLNWFSKTSVIKWHLVPKKTLIATILIWLGSVGVYLYDYNLGIRTLFFLSFLHVFLEFPLNFTTFTGIGKELSLLRKAK